MKLVLYSGGTPEQNIDLDAQLLRMLGNVNPRITFVPSCFDHTEEDYQDFCEHLNPHGLSATTIMHADQIESETEAYQALNADMIYLSGGNTFYFLESLRRARLIKLLTQFAKNDGIIAGVSAGAILMTPNIQTAGFPDFDRDENTNNLRNLKAMSLVPFEFFAHYRNRKSYDQEFKTYTQQHERVLYACPDGAGIVVYHNHINFVGDIAGFVNGKKFNLK